MKKKYSRKQIQEAISYWKKQLANGNYRKVNESDFDNFDLPGTFYKITLKDENGRVLDSHEWEVHEGEQSNSDGIVMALRKFARNVPAFAPYYEDYLKDDEAGLEDFGIGEEMWTSENGEFELEISPGLIPEW